MTQRRIAQVGFSQRVRLEWLERTPNLVLAGQIGRTADLDVPQARPKETSRGRRASTPEGEHNRAPETLRLRDPRAGLLEPRAVLPGAPSPWRRRSSGAACTSCLPASRSWRCATCLPKPLARAVSSVAGGSAQARAHVVDMAIAAGDIGRLGAGTGTRPGPRHRPSACRGVCVERTGTPGHTGPSGRGVPLACLPRARDR